MRKARIGVIGVGWWGTVGHLEPLSKDDQADIIAVQSRSIDKAQKAAGRYGVPHAYADFRRMIDECEMDGVIIATTPNVHYEQARYALEHGLHVLMEKPFVLQAQQAEHLAAIAQAKGLLLSVCSPNCFHPWIVESRRVVRSGALGKVQLMTHAYSQRVYDLYEGNVAGMFGASRGADDVRPGTASYSDPEVAGGGHAHGQISHSLSALLYITGLRPASVFAYMNKLDLAVDVVDTVSVRFEDGALANLSATGLIPRNMASLAMQVIGDQGLVDIDAFRQLGRCWVAGDAQPRPFEPAGRFDIVSPVPRNFVRAILGEEPIQVETQVAVDVVRILDAAYRSAASGQSVDLL